VRYHSYKGLVAFPTCECFQREELLDLDTGDRTSERKPYVYLRRVERGLPYFSSNVGMDDLGSTGKSL